MTTSELSILSEYQVALDRSINFKETLISHRERTPFAEVDLVFRGLSGLKLVEVKSWFHDHWSFSFLKARQLGRLMRARTFLEERHCLNVELLFAVVSHDRKALFRPNIQYFGFADLPIDMMG